MTRFVLGRAFQAVVTLLIVSAVVFVLGRVSGDPAHTMLSMDATLEERRQFVERMGLNRPLAYQYWLYLSRCGRACPPRRS
jgi:peptide/nickel transport system permease protein